MKFLVKFSNMIMLWRCLRRKKHRLKKAVDVRGLL
jgi:hypothetical protein